MKILKSINRDLPINPININLTSPTNTKIISNKEKAELFRKPYAKTSKKSIIPKEMRKRFYNSKQNIEKYVNTKTTSIESLIFTSYELDTAIKSLK